jgi:hypothetical protein
MLLLSAAAQAASLNSVLSVYKRRGNGIESSVHDATTATARSLTVRFSTRDPAEDRVRSCDVRSKALCQDAARLLDHSVAYT